MAVAPASSAEHAGVRAGDRLLSVDRNPARDLTEVRTLLRGLSAGDPLLLEVARGSETLLFESVVLEYPLERHSGARTLLGQVACDGRWLRAIAVVPEAPGAHACVYYLPGAHWASEEYPLELEQPVPALAGALARAGIGCVRVERSGIGDSQGPPCTELDFSGELHGYRAGLDWVLRQDFVDPERVFAFGHSLGAMVAPLLAEATTFAGIVTFGASAIPISEALVGALVRHAALDPGGAARERAEKVVELIRLVVAGSTPAVVFRDRPELAQAAPPHFTGNHAYHRSVEFYHQLERADLHGAWTRFRSDALFVHGDRDITSTLADSRALAALVGPRAEVQELAGVDHQMSDAASGARPRLAASVRESVLAWLEARIASPTP
jgi:pimeloyl-ACP methyl ester carboxylesterase